MFRANSHGTITFGLVSIPIKVYTAAKAEALHFNMLTSDGGRVKMTYINGSGEMVERNELEKGYEYVRGQYVKFTEEELKQFEVLNDKTISIQEFVTADSVDLLCIEKTHYLGPDKGGDKAYALLATVLEAEGKLAIAQWNTRGRQHLVALRPYQGKLMVHQLYYEHEIRDFDEIEVAKLPVSDAELDMARQLVNQQTAEGYDPSKYKDTYRAKVLEAVEQKVAGQDITVASADVAPSVVDLVDALKMSLSAAKPAPAKKTRKRRTPRKSKAQETQA